MFALSLLFCGPVAAACLGQTASTATQIDPDTVLARAELASAHNMFDPTVSEAMQGIIVDLREKIGDFDGLSQIEEKAILERFDAAMPKLIRDFQDELAARAVDEFTYLEFLYPATVGADRWDRISSGLSDRIIDVGAEYFSSIVNEGCAVQAQPSEGCQRLRQNLAEALQERGLD